MPGYISKRLTEQKDRIMSLWSERSRKEILAAAGTTQLALSDSIPIYLDHLAKALAENRRMDIRSVAMRDAQVVRIARLHGIDRAGHSTYSLTEVISEYHILREVIFEVLEEERPLERDARDMILCLIEQAVNDAAVQFTESHTDVQQKFISTLTHDLRTPITSGKAHAQLIQRQPGAVELCISSAKKIIASFNRLDSMIHDLLDASRIRAGESLTLEFEPCDLQAMLIEIVDEMSLIHGNRFQLLAEMPVQGLYGCDGLRRAIENLIGNAVKYSTPETPITIALKGDKRATTITVHNEGNPIPKEEQPILFQQYRRAKNAAVSAQTGWGLGLTLVKGVVDAHQGTVRVESEAGRGTSFIIELPLGAVSRAA